MGCLWGGRSQVGEVRGKPEVGVKKSVFFLETIFLYEALGAELRPARDLQCVNFAAIANLASLSHKLPPRAPQVLGKQPVAPECRPGLLLAFLCRRSGRQASGVLLLVAHSVLCGTKTSWSRWVADLFMLPPRAGARCVASGAHSAPARPPQLAGSRENLPDRAQRSRCQTDFRVAMAC